MSARHGAAATRDIGAMGPASGQTDGLGTALFHALFPGAAGDRYRASCDRAAAAGATLRLVLRLDAATDALPWELLVDPDAGRPLALRHPIVRAIDAADEPRPTIDGPLRVLVVVATPPGTTPLDAGSEVQGLRDTLQRLVESGAIQLRVVTTTSLAGLTRDAGGRPVARRALRRSRHARHDGHRRAGAARRRRRPRARARRRARQRVDGDGGRPPRRAQRLPHRGRRRRRRLRRHGRRPRPRRRPDRRRHAPRRHRRRGDRLRRRPLLQPRRWGGHRRGGDVGTAHCSTARRGSGRSGRRPSSRRGSVARPRRSCRAPTTTSASRSPGRPGCGRRAGRRCSCSPIAATATSASAARPSTRRPRSRRGSTRLFGAEVPERTTVASAGAIPRGTELVVDADVPGVETVVRDSPLTWSGDLAEVLVQVRAPATLVGRSVAGWVRVFSGPLLVAEAEVHFAVVADGAPIPPAPAPAAMRRFRRVLPVLLAGRRRARPRPRRDGRRTGRRRVRRRRARPRRHGARRLDGARAGRGRRVPAVLVDELDDVHPVPPAVGGRRGARPARLRAPAVLGAPDAPGSGPAAARSSPACGSSASPCLRSTTWPSHRRVSAPVGAAIPPPASLDISGERAAPPSRPTAAPPLKSARRPPFGVAALSLLGGIVGLRRSAMQTTTAIGADVDAGRRDHGQLDRCRSSGW